MDVERQDRLWWLRYLIGWFIVCVWLAGLPRVVDFTYSTAKSTYNTIKCELAECESAPLVRPGEDLVKSWIGKAKAGKIPPLDDEQIAYLMAVKEVNGL